MHYEVIRSNRKSLSLSVNQQNEIIIRCPRKTSDKQIEEFVKSKEDWLLKVLTKNEIRLSANYGILNYNEIYVRGEKLPIIISDKNKITNIAVYLKSLSAIKRTFISTFSDNFITAAQKISEELNLHVSGFSIRSYKRRWGCCNSEGKIVFNYMLFMLPDDLQLYVIVHELCHTVYFNHSAAFWKLVGSYLPDYKQLRIRLKSFDFITNLY